MTTLKQGDLIKDGYGHTRKVLGKCGGVVHLSYSGVARDSYLSSYTEFQLKDMGYTWDTPAWEIKMHDVYWHIDERGYVSKSIWDNDRADHARRDFLGVYQTKELCEAALLEIKRKLGK